MKLVPQLASHKSLHFYLWSHSNENKVKFFAKAVAFHGHPEDELDSSEEDSSAEVFSEEDLSDADQQQQQLPDDPKTPSKSQAPAMTPPHRKEEANKETKEDAESTCKVVRNLSL